MSGHVMSLKSRVIKSGSWVMVGYVLSQVLRLGSNLILTRLLYPEAFGLMVIVNALYIGLNMVSDIGIQQSIVRSRNGDSPLFLNTAWVVQILRGVLICLITLMVAYLLFLSTEAGWVSDGSVYADPQLPWMLSVFAISALVQGLTSTKISSMLRILNLKRLTMIDLLSQLMALMFMLALAMVYHTVWALVAGAFVATLTRTVLSHIWIDGFGNKVEWDRDYFSELFHFGKWMFLASILGFLALNGDRLLLGGLVSAQLLGIYSVAFLLMNSVSELFVSIIGKVAFSAIGEVSRSRPERLQSMVSKFQLLSDLLLFSAAAFLFTLGDELVKILYDERYYEAGDILGVISLGLIAMRLIVVRQCAVAIGNTRFVFLSSIPQVAALFAGVPVAFYQFGFDGALYAIVLSQFLAWPVLMHYKLKHHLIDWRFEFLGIPVFLSVMLLCRLISE